MSSATADISQAIQTSHLVNAPGTEWSFWRWVCLRSTGFPFDGVLTLAAGPGLVSAAEEMIQAMQAAGCIRHQAIAEVNSELDALWSSGRWDDKETRKTLLKVRALLNSQKFPKALPQTFSLEIIGRLKEAIQRVDETEARFKEQYAKSSEQTSKAISKIASLPNFREALTWQNRGFVQRYLDWFTRKSLQGSSCNRDQRRHEETVASYWQRYCTKNDTIGFFGPVGWAQFVPEVEHLSVTLGEELVNFRKTYWEAWGIEALGAAILKQWNVRKWLVPILMPFVRATGLLLHHPVFGAIRLTARQAALVAACDGRSTARIIAQKLLRSSGTQFQTENDVYQTLSELVAKRLVFWDFIIPAGAYPEQALQTALQRIEDTNIRQSALALLEECEEAKRSIEAAAGQPEKLYPALDNLEQVFTRITGQSATRNHGQAYAGRTLVYEDCRRDVKVLLGSQCLQGLAQPLSLFLLAGRWFTVQIAEIYKNKMFQIFTQSAKASGSRTIEAAVLWAHAAPFFGEDAATLVAPVQAEFRRKWEQVLRLGTGREPVAYSYEEIRPRILKEFAASRPGWISARYHSPDIMIAAESEEAVQRGDCFFVLGETHISVNTLNASLFINQHPSPEELLDAVGQDLRGLDVVPVLPKFEIYGSRTTPSLIKKDSVMLEYLPNSFISDRSRSLPVSSMIVENRNGELVVATRDGSFCLRAVDLLGALLSPLVCDCFKIVAPRPHTPRISIDRMVIKRESWSFSPEELPFAQCADSAEIFLQVRQWAHTNNIPRFTFFKVPVENKPAYLDLDSPILVSIFAKLVRRTLDAGLPDAKVDLSEMLPTAEQLWLKDKNNQRYTSEFRMVAVDSALVPQSQMGRPYVTHSR
jgi:lantibiotic biosynthesis dehydratase-like protein